MKKTAINLYNKIIYGNPEIFLSDGEKKVVDHLSNYKKTILIAGHPKSGNTWVRFVIFNYYNILNNGATETLTFDELNSAQCNVLQNQTTFPENSWSPLIYRTHYSYRKIFSYFDKIIYIYRNPLDCMISLYHQSKNREVPFYHEPENIRNKLFDVDYFVKYWFKNWIKYHRSISPKASVTLFYDDLKTYPENEFSKLLAIIDDAPNKDILLKSIEMSSFDSIKKMANDKNQLYGNANKKDFKGNFLRSGKVKQYDEQLTPKTINWVKEQLKKNNINIPI